MYPFVMCGLVVFLVGAYLLYKKLNPEIPEGTTRIVQLECGLYEVQRYAEVGHREPVGLDWCPCYMDPAGRVPARFKNLTEAHQFKDMTDTETERRSGKAYKVKKVIK